MNIRFPRQAIVFLAGLLVLAGILMLGPTREAQAIGNNPPAAQTYYLSMPADRSMAVLRNLRDEPKSPITSYTSIAIGVDDTIIYYDHHENGYVTDITNPLDSEIYDAATNPAGVQIWGDKDPDNGAPPGFPGDELNAGDVIILNNNIKVSNDDPYGRTNDNILYDGGDKVAASMSIAIVRSEWAATSSTLMSFAHELYPTNKWGTKYTAPVGCDSGSTMFDRTVFMVMAGDDGAKVRYNNGTQVTLAQGEARAFGLDTRNGCYSVKEGDTITSDKPVQVHLFLGNHSANYEIRDITLVPDEHLSTKYYNPVGFTAKEGKKTSGSTASTKSGPARVWLFNPNSNTIYVRCDLLNASDSVNLTIDAKKSRYHDIPDGSGAYCHAMNSTFTNDVNDTPFTGLVTMDSTPYSVGNYTAAGSAWDWSATLLPVERISAMALVGLGLGQDPNLSSSENGNPIWVTPICDTWFYADWDGDGAPDLISTNGTSDVAGSTNGIFVKRLESVKLYNLNTSDRPHSQTGALIYTRVSQGNVGKAGCKFAAAWGQDPPRASNAAPGLDVGTTVLPLVTPEISKGYTIVGDENGDGVADPGDTIEYEILIINIGLNEVREVYVYDEVPEHTTYVPGTTKAYLSGDGTGSPTVIADGPGGSFPLDATPNGVYLGEIPARPSFDDAPNSSRSPSR